MGLFLYIVLIPVPLITLKSLFNILILNIFLKECVANGEVCLEYVSTKQQLADIFTNTLPAATFEHLCEAIGVLALPH